MTQANGIDPARAHRARRRARADAERMLESRTEGMLEATGHPLWLEVAGDPGARARVTHVGPFALRAVVTTAGEMVSAGRARTSLAYGSPGTGSIVRSLAPG